MMRFVLLFFLCFSLATQSVLAIKCWSSNLDELPGEDPEKVVDCDNFGGGRQDICVITQSRPLSNPDADPIYFKNCGRSTEYFGYTQKCQSYEDLEVQATVCVCDTDQCNKELPSSTGLVFIGVGVAIVIVVAVVALGVVVVMKKGGITLPFGRTEATDYAGSVSNPNF